MTTDLDLPPDDHTTSPRTGYTRAHWEAAADGLLAAAWRWATPNGALLDLPGRPSSSGVRSDGLEGYARTFLAAAFRVAGAAGADPHGWLGRYADGLAAGTRTPGRDDAESWPLIRDIHIQGQPMVESASVALGLQLTRPWLWDRLEPAVRERTEHWLRDALRHTPSPNNWYLFPFTVASFLEAVGRGDEETRRARHQALELLEGWYRGRGWYTDGDGLAFDHYNGWALHLYPMLQAHLTQDTELTTVYGPRLRAHLESLALLFAADGAPVHFGRSLTYRFAASSAIALGAVTGHTPLPPGTSRRLASGCLRYFLDRGALDSYGLLSLGWHGPHRPTVQPYSGPASPYWASKAFVALLADAEHPLWTATETPAPSEDRDRILALPATGLLIHSTAADGVVRLHNHGSDHVRPEEGESAAAEDPLYARHAYSTHTGPTGRGNPADNHLAITLGSVRSVRRRIHPVGAGGDTVWGWAASWHQPVFRAGPPLVPGLRVVSVTVVRGPYEVRVHRVCGGPHGARAEQTGWATGPDRCPDSQLHPLLGWTDRDTVRAPQGTAFTPWASMPRLTADATGTHIFAAVATLTTEPPAVPASEAVTEATVADSALRLRWYDGAVTRVAFTSGTGVTCSWNADQAAP
ncbi:DUF2264 domain-containing protein [Streptomyces sp. NPDC059010]|uniref:DUF2264 domain-containing protein n=1 Tax=Streptomyces sp. NPDC059010 TaxID=3346695 RepID=UPI0036AA8A1D